MNNVYQAYAKSFPACHWGDASIERYNELIRRTLHDSFWAVYPEYCAPSYGIANTKTGMVNEGTTPGPEGTCDKSCQGDCLNFCYAIAHGDGVYPTARENHIVNTIARRRDPSGYYEYFFAAAEKLELPLRINETGDFENEAQIRAFIKSAKRHGTVRVIGYTKRESLLPLVKLANRLENVQLHYSLACCHKGEATARANGVPCTMVTWDARACSCPYQLKKFNAYKEAWEKAIAAGEGEKAAAEKAVKAAKEAAAGWHCRKCAELGTGCFADRDVAFLAH